MRVTTAERVDAVVVGGGPAGAAAAITLVRAGVARVHLVERRGRTSVRIGEDLPPAARPLLQSLGVWDTFLKAAQLPSYGKRSAWGSSRLTENDFIFNPHGDGWHVDRKSFDAMLVAAAVDAGVDHLLVDTVEVNSGDKRSVLRMRQLGQEFALSAAMIVDSTGRRAAIAQGRGARRVHCDRLVAVMAAHRPASAGDADSTTTVEAVEDGWWYTARIPGDRRVFAFLTDGDLLDVASAKEPKCWSARLAKTIYISEIAAAFRYTLCDMPVVVSAISSYLNQPFGADWIAAGDAAFSCDPLSSQGILTALSTGRQAALAVLKPIDGSRDKTAIEHYAANIRHLREEYLLRRRQVYGAERRWPNSVFWNRRRDWSRAGLHATG